MTTPRDQWPPDVHPIAVEDFERLGINAANELFWDGRRIEIRRPLILTWPQKIAAGIVTVFAILGGLGALVSGVKDGAEFLCARDIQWLSCPTEPTALTPEEAE